MNHHFNVIRRHQNSLLVLNLILFLATLFSAMVLADIWSPPIWKARAKFNVPSSGGNLSADLGTLGSIRDSAAGFSREVSPLQIQSTIITSDAVMDKTWSIDPEKQGFSTSKSFKSLFTVEPQPQSTIIAIEARGSSPDLALERATNLANAYQKRLNQLRYSDADFRQEFAQEEFTKAKDNLRSAQQELARFRLSRGIVDSDSQTQQLVSSIHQLKTQLTLLKSEAEASQTRAEIAANYFNTPPDKAIQLLNLAENQEYQEARQKLAQTEIELSEARSQYTNASPQLQDILSKRKQLTQELAKRVRIAIPNSSHQNLDLTLGGNGSNKRLDMISDLITAQTTSQGLKQQTIQIQNQIARLTNELDAISVNKTKLVELERQHNIAEGVYKGIIAQINRAKIDHFNSYPNVQLIDGPHLDPEPDTPSKKLIVLGGLLASIFGSLSLLLFLESSAPLLSPKDLMLVEYPILFRIAHFKQLYISWDSIPKRDLPGSDNLKSWGPRLFEGGANIDNEVSSNSQYDYGYSAEREFERLATIFCSLELENRRIMITSATAGEGKTTITLGLAIALKKLGFRILIVDSDLQRASLSKSLNIMPEKCNPEDKKTQPIINLSYGLDLLPAPAVPRNETSQFFTRGNFAQELEQIQAEGNYDYVLVDTSPIHLTSESMLIAPIIENVLFVVRSGISDRYSVMNSLEDLKLHQTQIKGLIVNGVNSPGDSYRYSYQPQLPQTLTSSHQALRAEVMSHK